MISIHQVMIFVNDLETSRKFYNEILDIPIKQDFSKQMGMLIMDSNGVIFTIHSGYKKSLDADEYSRTCIAFSVQDLDEMLQKLKNENVEFIGKIHTSPIHKYQMIKDPSGNIVEIAQYFG